ncbi:MAG: transaldolase, partial [Proteobacteria bacterium]|nr:transaldolase [Pseudomonadota bacterium]
MSTNPLLLLQNEGVSVWLDYLSRDLMNEGGLQKLIDEDGLRGETSNPAIFQKAISHGESYS